jgi:hypothetical protein
MQVLDSTEESTSDSFRSVIDDLTIKSIALAVILSFLPAFNLTIDILQTRS